jgi:hypothetical protein
MRVRKKVDKDVEYAYKGRFTTCNLDTPHFDIRAKIKLTTINWQFRAGFSEFEGVRCLSQYLLAFTRLAGEDIQFYYLRALLQIMFLGLGWRAWDIIRCLTTTGIQE